MAVALKYAWQLLFVSILVMTGHSCYVGPDLQFWDLDEDNASAKMGMPLFIVPAAEWVSYSNVPGLEVNFYRVYECDWRDRPKEWVVYRRLQSSFSIFRIFTSDFSRRDFNTESEVEAVTGSLSGWIAYDANVFPIMNNNYRVYDCSWRNGTKEWVVIDKANSQWCRKVKP